MKFTDNNSRIDGRAGILYVCAQDNGEGWWNWWVSTEPPGTCPGERGVVAQGSEPRAHLAVERIIAAVEVVIRDIRFALQEPS